MLLRCLSELFRIYPGPSSKIFSEFQLEFLFCWDFHKLLLMFLMEFLSRFLLEMFAGFSSHLSAGFLTVILLGFYKDFPGIAPRVLSEIPTENCSRIMGVFLGIALLVSSGALQGAFLAIVPIVPRRIFPDFLLRFTQRKFLPSSIPGSVPECLSEYFADVAEKFLSEFLLGFLLNAFSQFLPVSLAEFPQEFSTELLPAFLQESFLRFLLELFPEFLPEVVPLLLSVYFLL